MPWCPRRSWRRTGRAWRRPSSCPRSTASSRRSPARPCRSESRSKPSDSGSALQDHHGRSETASLRGGVEKVGDPKVAREEPPHFRPADSAPLSVDQPDLGKSTAPRFVEIVRDDASDVARKERVEIEGIFDRNPLQVETVRPVALP